MSLTENHIKSIVDKAYMKVMGQCYANSDGIEERKTMEEVTNTVVVSRTNSCAHLGAHVE